MSDIEITHSHMGWSKIIDKNGIPKYPGCIECNERFSLIEQKDDKKVVTLIFYGDLKNSKGYSVWEFEVEVGFIMKADATFTKEQIEEFMVAAYDRARKSFDNFVTKKELFRDFFLCEEKRFSVSHFFA